MGKPKLRISRKLQVLMNLTLIMGLLFALYIFAGSPCSLEQYYRRMEKANHIGPGAILGVESVSGDGAPQVVLAQTEDAVTLAGINQKSDGSYWANHLFYLQKSGDITISVAPVDLRVGYSNKESSITLFVFDEYPQAVSAQIEFELFWEEDPSSIHRQEYSLYAEREDKRYFRFDLVFTYDKYKTDPQAEAIFQLSSVWCYPSGWTLPDDAYPAIVRLFDAFGNVVAERELQLIAQKQ